MSIDTRKILSNRTKVFIALILGLIGIWISNLNESFAYVTTTVILTPPDYLTFQPPAKGGSYTDPVFGTAIKRLSDAMHTTDAGTGGMVTTIGSEYSTMTPFNKDNTRLLIQHFSYFALYDGAGNFLKDLYQYGVHASSEPRWSRSDPNTFYFVNGNQLKRFNVGTLTSSVVHTFSEYSSISGKGESDISFDGNYFVFAGNNRYVFVYDIANDSKGPTFDTDGHSFDSLYITPDNHVTITWLTSGSSRFNGIEMFDKNMNFLRQLTHAGGHMDVSRDTNGDEVLLWAAHGDPKPEISCDAGVVKVHLADAKKTCVWKSDWTQAIHVSAPDNNGWFFVETYVPRDPIPPAGWTLYASELLQVKIDGSEVRRLAHHRSRPFNSYTYTPRVSTSRDGAKIVFSSNYGLQAILGYPSRYSDAYMIDLAGDSSSTGGTSTGTTTSNGGTPAGGTSTGETSGTTTGGTTTTSSGTSTSSGTTTSGTTTSGTTTTTGTTTGTTTVTRIEQNGAGVVYSGTWSNNGATIHSASGAALSMETNARGTLTFNGTGVTVLGFRDQWAGIARIYVDGTVKGEVDTYATTSKAQVPMYSISGLNAGTHTIAVEVTGTKNTASGGKWIWIDAFDVQSGNATSSGSTSTTSGTTSTTETTASGTTISSGTTSSSGTTTSSGTTSTSGTATAAPPPPPPAPIGILYRIEQSNSAVRYTGSWKLHNSSAHSGRSAKLAMNAGYRATLTFVGTSVTWIAFRDPWSGVARVYIDGALRAEIDTYSPSSQSKTAVYNLSNLTWGTHTIAIEPAGRRNIASRGNWIWLDAFDYVGEALTSALTSDSTADASPVKIAGGVSFTTSGGQSLQVGSAQVDAGLLGQAPSGLAIFGYRQNGVLISEAGVPASAPVLKGRIYAEIAGPVTTGFAVANPNSSEATISFFFTDSNGSDSGQGTLKIPAHGQIARFLNQAPFNGAQSMRGTFTFNSDVPVSAIALRGFTNERGDFLVTTLPVADPDQWMPASVFFPHFADGAGWSTQFVLVNPTNEAISGTLSFFEHGSGSTTGNLTLTVDGQSRSSVSYAIPPRSAQKFSTAGSGSAIAVGSAQVTPDESNASPVGVAIFSVKSGGVTVSEAGIPSSDTGNAFRMYAEASTASSVRTGVAINNVSQNETQITFELANLDGTSTGLRGYITVPAFGQRAVFLNEIPGLQSLPASFKGILRVSSDTDITVSGLRTRVNERGSFLITTTAPTNEATSFASKAVFPHIVDGGGYTTQFILYSGYPGQPASGNLQLLSESGGTLDIGLKD